MPKHDYPLHPGQTHAEPYYCTIPLEEYEALKKRVRELERVKVLPDGTHIMCPADAVPYIEQVVNDFTTWRNIEDKHLVLYRNRFVLVKVAGSDIPEVAMFYPVTRIFKNRNGKTVPNVKQWRPIY